MQTSLKIFEHIEGPHRDSLVLIEKPLSASVAIILVHGRGGDASSMLSWGKDVAPEAFLLAPQAKSNSWYPERFLVPQHENQPALDSALAALDTTVTYAVEAGLPSDGLILVGFSQGACVVAEYAKRHPARYRGIALMSGGLIGTDEEVAVSVRGDCAGTPVYIGCDVADPYIPMHRVEATAYYFTEHGADVDLKRYTDYGHAIHPDAVSFITALAA